MRKIIHGGDIYTKRSNKNIIDFSANINPLGIPLSVKKAIVDNIDNFMNYPDPQCREIRKAISDYYCIDDNMIVCGNGAADIIYRLALALKPKEALVLAPTFSEYEDALKLVNCNVNYYSLSEQSGFVIGEDILNSISRDIDIMFLCNPNNPTGIPLENDKVLRIAEKCKENNVTLIVDECFTDFLIDEEKYTIVSYLNDYENVVILKAFTKIYAMAGIRLGYMISSNQKLNYNVSNTLQPWGVSSVAIKCGVAALKEEGFVSETKIYIKKNREYLIDNLKKLNIRVFDSQANYILLKCEDSKIKDKLEEYGILIRSCSNYYNLDNNFYRIAVKSSEDNEKLIEVLRKIKGADYCVSNNGNN